MSTQLTVSAVAATVYDTVDVNDESVVLAAADGLDALLDSSVLNANFLRQEV